MRYGGRYRSGTQGYARARIRWYGPGQGGRGAAAHGLYVRHGRCDDEVCSRVEVHRGLLRKQVLYVPYSAIAAVSGKDVVLYIDARTAGAKGWSRKPAWLPGEIEVVPGRRMDGGSSTGSPMV